MTTPDDKAALERVLARADHGEPDEVREARAYVSALTREVEELRGEAVDREATIDQSEESIGALCRGREVLKAQLAEHQAAVREWAERGRAQNQFCDDKYCEITYCIAERALLALAVRAGGKEDRS